MEQEETLIEGWCGNCTCKNHYHVGDNNGICIDCKCPEFDPDDASDLLDRLKGIIFSSFYEQEREFKVLDENGLTEEDFGEEEFFLSVPEVYSSEVEKPVIFLGKASRECSSCGDIKLYKDFSSPTNPDTFCKYCAWEKAGELELEDLEDQIIENEMAYEDALERQEMIDECLRGLDE